MTKTKAKPKYEFHRNENVISIVRDNILFRIYPEQLKFQLDRLGEGNKSDQEYREIVQSSKVNKSLFGIFGFLKMKAISYLVLIEEASVVGTLLKGTINRVEKLLFLPLNMDTKLKIEPED